MFDLSELTRIKRGWFPKCYHSLYVNDTKNSESRFYHVLQFFDILTFDQINWVTIYEYNTWIIRNLNYNNLITIPLVSVAQTDSMIIHDDVKYTGV